MDPYQLIGQEFHIYLFQIFLNIKKRPNCIRIQERMQDPKGTIIKTILI